MIDPSQPITSCDEIVWTIVVVTALLGFGHVFMTWKRRPYCDLCGKRHIARPGNMSAEDYALYFCAGWKKIRKDKGL